MVNSPPSGVPVRLGAPTTIQDANGEDPVVSFYDDGAVPLALGAIQGMDHSPPQNRNPLANAGFDPHRRYLQESPTRAPQAGAAAPLPSPTRIGREAHDVIRRNSASGSKQHGHDDRKSWESTTSARSVEDSAQLASLAKMRVMADRQQEDVAAGNNSQRVIDRKFSRSSIDQQLLVQRDEPELTMILSDYAMSPTTQDQLYESSFQNVQHADVNAGRPATQQSHGTVSGSGSSGATTRQSSPRRGMQSRQSHRSTASTPYGFGSASEADSDDSMEGFGPDAGGIDTELQRMSQNMEHIEHDFESSELNSIENNFSQRTARPTAPNPDSVDDFL